MYRCYSNQAYSNITVFYFSVGFDYDDATVLSECTIIGSYIIQTIINWPKHHPADKTRHIIYWDAVLILLPAQLGGSNIGSILKNGLPATIMEILAVLVVTFAAVKTFIKGIHYWSEENKNKEKLLSNNSTYSNTVIIKM